MRILAGSVAAALAVAGFVLAAGTDLRMPAAAWWVAVILLALVTIGWIAGLATVHVHGDRRLLLATAALPLSIVLSALVLSLTGVSFQARWQTERADFRPAAEAILDDTDPATLTGTRIGSRTLGTVWRADDQPVVFFPFTGTSPITCGEAGVVYAAPPLDPATALTTYKTLTVDELGDGWWRYQLCGLTD